ncbi:hypothetical protein BD626DRAFT_352223, partial [Schizophyllum amplum]
SPNSCDDMLCSCMDVADLISYSLVCRDTRRTVDNYKRRAYRLHRVLCRFMSYDDVDRFRVLQTLTGAVVSGSIALQFLDRVNYSACDMDVYTDVHHVYEVFAFFSNIGYLYQPRISHARDAMDEEAVPTNEVGYKIRSVAGVYNFTRPSCPTAKVQLIIARHAVIDVILDFHSCNSHHLAVVMNIITHYAAYSLYPYETFIARRGLCLNKEYGAASRPILDKYRDRGWRMLHRVVDAAGSQFAEGTRFVGDRMTWVVPL